jgi:hypothetical protein
MHWMPTKSMAKPDNIPTLPVVCPRIALRPAPEASAVGANATPLDRDSDDCREAGILTGSATIGLPRAAMLAAEPAQIPVTRQASPGRCAIVAAANGPRLQQRAAATARGGNSARKWIPRSRWLPSAHGRRRSGALHGPAWARACGVWPGRIGSACPSGTGCTCWHWAAPTTPTSPLRRGGWRRRSGRSAPRPTGRSCGTTSVTCSPTTAPASASQTGGSRPSPPSVVPASWVP